MKANKQLGWKSIGRPRDNKPYSCHRRNALGNEDVDDARGTGTPWQKATTSKGKRIYGPRYVFEAAATAVYILAE
jgi:hypothetical protein